MKVKVNIGGLANSITKPFGVKLFKGGPYPDNGMGDQAQSQQELANANAKTQAGYGNTLLFNSVGSPLTNAINNGVNLVRNPLTNAINNGFNSVGSPLTNAINNGVARTGDMANYTTNLKNFAAYNGLSAPGSVDNNPGGLLPWQQDQLNKEVGQMNTARQNALNAEIQNLARQGITGGQAYDNALQRINQSYDQIQQQHSSDFNATAQQHKAQAAQVMAGLQQAGGQYDLQNQQARVGNLMNEANLGNQMLGNSSATYENAASLLNNIGQQARQNNAANNQFWQGIAGAVAGKFLPDIFGSGAKSGSGNNGGIYGGSNGITLNQNTNLPIQTRNTWQNTIQLPYGNVDLGNINNYNGVTGNGQIYSFNGQPTKGQMHLFETGFNPSNNSFLIGINRTSQG
jgi:hypothetical protein